LGRLEKFRQERYYRRRLRISLVLFFLLLIIGTTLADFSVNSLMNGRDGLNMLMFSSNGSNLEIVIMNRKINIDTTYIKQDIDRIKGYIVNMLGLN